MASCHFVILALFRCFHQCEKQRKCRQDTLAPSITRRRSELQPSMEKLDPASELSTPSTNYAHRALRMINRWIGVRTIVQRPASSSAQIKVVVREDTRMTVWALCYQAIVEWMLPWSLLPWMLPVHSQHFPERCSGLIVLMFCGALAAT